MYYNYEWKLSFNNYPNVWDYKKINWNIILDIVMWDAWKKIKQIPYSIRDIKILENAKEWYKEL